MSKYELIEDGYCFDTVEAESAEEALDQAEPAATGSYDTSGGTIWTTIHASRVCDCERDGDGDDSDCRTFAIDPEEPECSEADGHDWQEPYEILGGLRENPGVWGHGGGVIMRSVCMHCGCERATDTWAQRPDTGEQGLTSVRYEPGKYADEIAEMRGEESES